MGVIDHGQTCLERLLAHVASRLRILDGINAARAIFPLCYFDEQKCARPGKATPISGTFQNPVVDSSG